MRDGFKKMIPHDEAAAKSPHVRELFNMRERARQELETALRSPDCDQEMLSHLMDTLLVLSTKLAGAEVLESSGVSFARRAS